MIGRRRAERTPGQRRHLVLVGGGHAHVHVLRMLATRPIPGTRITVISPTALSVYSGMLPGTLVGLYGTDEGTIDVAALAARAGATFLADEVISLEPARRQAVAKLRGSIPYDLISLDVGSRPQGAATAAGYEHVVVVRPVERAIDAIARFMERVESGEAPPRAAVVGGGAGGFELAFALCARLAGHADARVALVERAARVLPSGSARLQALAADLCRRYGVEAVTNADGVQPSERGVALADGRAVDAALVLWSTSAAGLPFLRSSGLPLDERGFLWVDDSLRSTGAAEVFAAGDCAAMVRHPDLPRAGVYAVRQGTILLHNLRAALGSRRFCRYDPQRGHLSLLSTGDGRAVLSYKGFAAHGRVWWLLKDWIDRRFVARHAPPRADALQPAGTPRSRSMGQGTMTPCGGCAAKLDPAALATTLDAFVQAAPPARGDVVVGLAERDDGAVLRHAPDADLVTTVDAFPPFLPDLYHVGSVAAVNALSDVYAMGGIPYAALALVSVAAEAAGDETNVAAAADLAQLLSGARTALDRAEVELVGGHTIAGAETWIGFAVLGRVARDAAWTKAGAQAGDLLVLTKPLGTGVVLAATRAGECPAAWTEAALTCMEASNARAAEILAAHAVRACTDVSGFGLAGHLGEMLHAGRVSARLWTETLPALPGALELLAAGWRSSAAPSLEARARAIVVGKDGFDGGDPRAALLCDPQTSGGLLAAVPAERIVAALSALHAAGVAAACIGEIAAGDAALVHLENAPSDLASRTGLRVAGARGSEPG